MEIILGAIGRLKDGPDRDLYQRYAERFAAAGRAQGCAPIRLIELAEAKSGTAAQRRADESARLAAATDTAEVRFLLTEHGRQHDSEAFAKMIGAMRDGGTSRIAFLIGGPDGHDPDFVAQHRGRLLSLGAMTFPHGLARIVLAEQLYRTVTILSGHPYHRGAAS